MTHRGEEHILVLQPGDTPQHPGDMKLRVPHTPQVASLLNTLNADALETTSARVSLNVIDHAGNLVAQHPVRIRPHAHTPRTHGRAPSRPSRDTAMTAGQTASTGVSCPVAMRTVHQEGSGDAQEHADLTATHNY